MKDFRKFFRNTIQQKYPADWQAVMQTMDAHYTDVSRDTAFALTSPNPIDRRLDFCAYFLALIITLEGKGESFETIRATCLTITYAYVQPKNKFQHFIKRLLPKLIHTPIAKLLLRSFHKRVSHNENPNGFIAHIITDKAQTFGFGYGVDIVECGICKLFTRHNYYKYASILCEVDEVTSDLAGLELIRSGTIARGASHCDFRYRPKSVRVIARNRCPAIVSGEKIHHCLLDTNWYLCNMRDPEATREKILKKSGILFNTKGYKATSISEITDATGFTKGAIYRHFKSKEELEKESLFQLSMVMMEDLKGRIKQQLTAPEKLKATFRYFESYLDKPVVKGGCPLMNAAIEADDAHPALRKTALKVLDILHKSVVTILENGIRYKQLKPDIDKDFYASVIIAALEGAIMMSKLRGNNDDMKRVMKHLENQLKDLIV